MLEINFLSWATGQIKAIPSYVKEGFSHYKSYLEKIMSIFRVKSESEADSTLLSRPSDSSRGGGDEGQIAKKDDHVTTDSMPPWKNLTIKKSDVVSQSGVKYVMRPVPVIYFTTENCVQNAPRDQQISPKPRETMDLNMDLNMDLSIVRDDEYHFPQKTLVAPKFHDIPEHLITIGNVLDFESTTERETRIEREKEQAEFEAEEASWAKKFAKQAELEKKRKRENLIKDRSEYDDMCDKFSIKNIGSFTDVMDFQTFHTYKEQVRQDEMFGRVDRALARMGWDSNLHSSARERY